MSQAINFEVKKQIPQVGRYQPDLFVSPIKSSTKLSDVANFFSTAGLGRVREVVIKPGKFADFAVVKFDYWYLNDTVYERETFLRGGKIQMYYYRDNFWNVSEYKKISERPTRNMESVRMHHGHASVTRAQNLPRPAPVTRVQIQSRPRPVEVTPAAVNHSRESDYANDSDVAVIPVEVTPAAVKHSRESDYEIEQPIAVHRSDYYDVDKPPEELLEFDYGDCVVPPKRKVKIILTHNK